MKWSEVHISLNHDFMASFSLHKWPWRPKSGAHLVGVIVWGCNHMALRQHTNSSNTLYMSNMDVWSGLRWILASTMTLWHHFCSTSNPDFPNLGPTCLVSRYEGAPTCPWDSIPMAQTLCLCLVWMYEVVWGGYKPQTWRNDIIFTPKVTLTSQIWGQLGRCHGVRVQPYTLETAYQGLKHFVYVEYGCMKQSEVDISLNHDVMASFSLHKGPKILISWANLVGVTVYGGNHIPLRQHTNSSNTFWMYKAVWGGYQPQPWRNDIIFTS